MSDPEKKRPVTNYQQWKGFIESPAWKELEGHIVEYLTDLINPGPVVDGGLDDLVERGVKERVRMALERFFFELPLELLQEKKEGWDEGSDVDRWKQDTEN